MLVGLLVLVVFVGASGGRRREASFPGRRLPSAGHPLRPNAGCLGLPRPSWDLVKILVKSRNPIRNPIRNPSKNPRKNPRKIQKIEKFLKNSKNPTKPRRLPMTSLGPPMHSYDLLGPPRTS